MKNIKNLLNNGLYLVATPIGNLNDISLRALKILRESKFIVCENPLHSSKLLKEYDIKKKLLSLHDYNEDAIINKVSKHLSKSIVCLISDSGSPLISDPGFKLVKYCIEKNIFVTSVPGATSIIPSLQLSGIPINSFTFNGFIPKKIKSANELLETSKNIAGAQIFFSSSHRLIENIKLIKKYFGNRKITVCKEITKLNEQYLRANVNEVIDKLDNKYFKIKGEFVLIIEGENKTNVSQINKNTIEIMLDISKKFSLTETVKIVHKLSGISKKDLYEIALLKLKDGNE